MPNDFQLEFLMEILKLGPKCGADSKDHLQDFINLNEKVTDIFVGAAER